MNMGQKDSVLNWIDEHQDEAVQFLQELVQIPSVNSWFDTKGAYKGEGNAQRLAAEFMKELGAAVDLWEPDPEELSKYEGQPGYFADHTFRDRPNMAATLKGTGGGKSLLLMGHIDTVKEGSGWTKDPFGGEIEEGRLYGRGAVDMKGGIAAMMMALRAVSKSGIVLKGDVCVGTVVDEESGGMGALAFVDRGYRADACIMTEATQMKIAPLCRGILWGKVTLTGRSGHIELPQKDWREGGTVDAIQKARLLLDSFDRLNRDWSLRKVHPLLKVPCQLLVGQVVAGEFPSTYANKAEISFDIQFLPKERDHFGGGKLVMQEVEEFIRKVSETDTWLKEHPPVVEWMVNADCGETDSGHPFVQTLCNCLKEIGYKPELEGSYFHTDMGWPERVGIPTVNFGPGDPAVAHQDNEFVPVEEYIEAVKMIALAIMEWCQVEG